MKKTFSIFLLLFLLSWPSFSQGKTLPFAIEAGLGPAINFYSSEKTDTMTGLIDAGGYSRLPMFFNISAVFDIYENLQAVASMSDLLDIYMFDDGNLTLNTLSVNPAIRYLLPIKGFFVETGWGLAILFPSTDLSYNGGVEAGSVFQFTAGYKFKAKKRLAPAAGIRFSRSELLESSITSIALFADLYFR